MTPPRIFLSYARSDDEAFVRRLFLDLTAAGHTVWWDRESMPNRALTFLQEIRDAVEAAERLILVIGPGAIGSAYVTAEWEHALLFGRSVVPILRTGDYQSVPEPLAKFHVPDFRASRPYADALGELRRILDEPVAPLAPLYGVPALPPHFVPRKADLEAITASLLGDVLRPMVIASHQQTTALLGMGGVGKTTLAVSFARATETRRAFADGVIWASVGQTRDPLSVLRLIGAALGDALTEYGELEPAKQRLARALAHTTHLIVLDDVWDVTQAEPVVAVLGARSRLLVTTREGALASSLGGGEHRLDVMSPEDGLRLLAQWADVEVTSLPRTDAADVAHECGYLPFALALCGALVRDGVSWRDVHTALLGADLAFIGRRLPGYPYPSVFRSLQVSLDWLTASAPEQAARYRELAAFPPAEDIPEAALTTLWAHTAGLSDHQSRRLLVALERKALLLLRGTEPHRRLRLHDLQHDYLRSLVEDPPSPHRQVLAAYAARMPDGWTSAPNDGYFLEHVAYHYVLAGARDDLAVLLRTLTFLETKAAAGLVFDLVRDFDAALRVLEATSDASRQLRILGQAIRTDAHFIARHPQLLFQCCWNRVWWYDSPAARGHYRRADGVRVADDDGAPRASPLSALMDAWREDWTARHPNSSWLRSHRPPPVALGSALRAKLTGHRYGVTDVAFAPDGTRLASVDTHDLRVWDVATGRACFVVPRAAELLTGSYSVAYSPDGRHILTSAYVHPARQDPHGGRLRLVDADDGRVVATIHDGGSIMRCAYSPDGTLIASGTGDGRLRLWNAVRHTPLRYVSVDGSAVERLAFSPDSRRVACTRMNGSVHVFDVQDGALLLAIEPRLPFKNGLAYSPDGRLIAVGTHGVGVTHEERQSRVEIFAADTGTATRQLPGHGVEVTSIAFAPDGTSIASAGRDYTVRVWDLARGRERLRAEADDEGLNGLTCSPDGTLLAAGSSSGAVLIWDVAGNPSAGMLEGHERWVSSMAFSPDSARLATTSDDATVRVWDVQSGREIRVLAGHTAWTRSATYSPDGRWLATASGDHTARIWDAETGAEIHVLRAHTQSVDVVAFSPDSRSLASGGSDNTVRLWDVATGEHWGVLATERSASVLRFSEDGAQLTSIHIDEGYADAVTWELRSGSVVSRSDDPPSPAERGEDAAASAVAFPWFRELGLFAKAAPSGRTWAATSGRHLYLFTLEASRRLTST